MQIVLNLLPPEKKDSLRQGYIAAYARALLVLLFIVAVALSVTLASYRIMLKGTLDGLKQQNQDLMSEDDAPEAEILAIDGFLTRVEGLQDDFIPWSGVLEEISKIVPDGVILSSVQVNDDGKVFIRGNAATRDDVLAFQASLEALPFFTEINAPLSNILKKTDVGFDFETMYVRPEAEN